MSVGLCEKGRATEIVSRWFPPLHWDDRATILSSLSRKACKLTNKLDFVRRVSLLSSFLFQDESVLTILCNHSFHTHCLTQWEDSTLVPSYPISFIHSDYSIPMPPDVLFVGTIRHQNQVVKTNASFATPMKYV